MSVIGSILKCFQSLRQHIIDTDILQISIDLLRRKSNTGHTKGVRGRAKGFCMTSREWSE